MTTRRLLLAGFCLLSALLCFVLGALSARRADALVRAAYDAKLDAIRAELHAARSGTRGLPVAAAQVTGTSGSPEVQDGVPATVASDAPGATSSRAHLVAEIEEDLESEMGLVPVRLLRDRQASFVEMYSYDSEGKTNYGTAGYLGGGYFLTVKHGVVALAGDDDGDGKRRRMLSIRLLISGKEMPAKIVDVGDADVEVDRGDWAVIRTEQAPDLPPLHIDSGFGYEFATPVFRLGNDYSKGIILSSGYVGQRMANGLVTCLTDGHPGVSGGGVLDQRGDLVGIPIGRMQGDYRFSFILPLRHEMFRKIPGFDQP